MMEVDSAVLSDTLEALAALGPGWVSFTLIAVTFVIMLPSIIKEAGPHIVEWKKLTNKQKENAQKVRNAASDTRHSAATGPSARRIGTE